MTDQTPAVVEAAEPVRVLTPAPILAAELKRKFKENIEFVIDYKNSRFKDKIFITYLSNIDVKCELLLEGEEETLRLVGHYMRHPGLVFLPELMDIAMHILLAYLKKPSRLNFDPTDFIAQNEDIIKVWMRRVASLYLYGLYVDSTISRDVFANFPRDDDYTLPGINYVHLIKHPHFGLLMEGIPNSAITFNEYMFSEYMFAGKNLYHYFAVLENPLYAGIMSRHRLTPENFDRLLYASVGREYVPSIG